MAKKKSWTPKEEAEISRIRQTTGATRKTAIRKMRAAAKAKPKVKAQKATKTTTPAQSLPKGVAGMNRSVLRIARKDIVLNQQNKRWECEANTARGDNALRKLSLILTQTSELLA